MLLSLLKRSLPRNNWGDAVYAAVQYRYRQGRWPREATQAWFSDRLYALKVNGSLRDPLRRFVTDKECVKQYIVGVVGWRYVAETYHVVRTKTAVEQLVLERFPCVVKPTHLSGRVEIHRGADEPLRRGVVKKWLDIDYYRKSREQNYRGLEPKVIVEEFLSEDGETVPEDYKVFCFEGTPKLIQVDSDRFANRTRTLYDTAWNKLPVTLTYRNTSELHPKPAVLDEMLHVAARLARPFSFIRVDLYVVGDRVNVGELTSCPGSAGEHLRPLSAEIVLGRLFEAEQTVVGEEAFSLGDAVP